MKLGISLALVAACSSNSNPGKQIDAPPPNPDAKEFMDAAPNVPAMITISGVAGDGGSGGSSTPKQGVAVSVFATSNESTPLGTATTDAQGKFSIMVATGGHPIDGFVKATLSGYKDTYNYPPGSWFKDSTVELNMITPGNFGIVPALCGVSQDSAKGEVALAVLDSSGMPVGGATVASTPGSDDCYFSGGIPSGSAHMTDSGGFAFMFNVPGQATLSANKTGMVFKSHPVNAHPNAFTMTVVEQ